MISCWMLRELGARTTCVSCWTKASASSAETRFACVSSKPIYCAISRQNLVPRTRFFYSIARIDSLSLANTRCDETDFVCVNTLLLHFFAQLKFHACFRVGRARVAISGGECDAQFGNTALIRAAGNSCADCVRLLLDAGADKEARDNVSVGGGIFHVPVVTEVAPHPQKTCILFRPSCILLFCPALGFSSVDVCAS